MSTWNPSDKGANIVLSNGNLTATGGTAAWQTVRNTLSRSTGKWYWECTITNATASSICGVATSAFTPLTDYLGQATYSAGIAAPTAGTYINGPTQVNAPGLSFTTNDVMMFAIDLDGGKMWTGKNGAWPNSGNPATGANPWCTFTANTAFFPGASVDATTASITGNFGASAFAYTPPTGFSAWSNYNLSLGAAVFTFTPAAINLSRAAHMVLGVVAFTFTPAAIFLRKGKVLALGALSYAFTPASIPLVHYVAPALKIANRVIRFVLQQLRIVQPTLGD